MLLLLLLPLLLLLLMCAANPCICVALRMRLAHLLCRCDVCQDCIPLVGHNARGSAHSLQDTLQPTGFG
jgi:hypothetical protein